ncbi:MAG: pyrroline-5-carboxylate reductase [Halorhodospira halophila]|uniref:pyrroline-5-carboxylate reductase n=1 Tax=Halorhodospira TaxID=85108 RepID=UPI0019144039|nr:MULTISPECIES: pyrroline-5-carboxylate reductase [Halorhodospira]MBK5935921.1 pyrroline-5-carboxylate reductase [Halorhodospira halophila]MBK5943267.1 pyrroline-5-carboxylate reductase [Halorhodospira halophila]MCC3751471.1 pyrroline-5-carboxylate reductase [Halorhodospira halophila]MCG5526789.1 pyrroline-5-carboxylate reductase [Halorhodospira halophila]MCG5533359.1 pyrroline-5-carboxylate reductase [Halorhodospira sp. 9621]
MAQHARIAFIGGGNMARSLIGGLIADGYPATHIVASEPETERRERLAGELGIETCADNAAAAEAADAVILAVKPQVMRGVAEALGPIIARRGAVAISIAAGIRLGDLQRWLGAGTAIVRTMPNTPSLVQSGATALYANEQASEAQRELAETLLRAVGQTRWLENEQQMDAVTAISGSGPAYFFLVMEALEEAGVELGLDRETARLLTLETATGAARMALESDDPPAQLRQRVTSPGGTTERALEVLEASDLRGALQRAAEAAATRADELGNLLGEQ